MTSPSLDGDAQSRPTPLPEPDAAYPRPQLVRERWTDLSGAWQFAFDDDDAGIDGRWYEALDVADRSVFDRDITVPYPPESPASGVGDTGYHPVLWYRRAFDRPRTAPGERLMLRFGAVDFSAAGGGNRPGPTRHDGGHTPFAADVTGALTESGPQVIVVRAQ